MLGQRKIVAEADPLSEAKLGHLLEAWLNRQIYRSSGWVSGGIAEPRIKPDDDGLEKKNFGLKQV